MHYLEKIILFHQFNAIQSKTITEGRSQNVNCAIIAINGARSRQYIFKTLLWLCYTPSIGTSFKRNVLSIISIYYFLERLTHRKC